MEGMEKSFSFSSSSSTINWKLFYYFWQFLKKDLLICFAASSLGSSTWDLHCVMWDLWGWCRDSPVEDGTQTLQLRCRGFVAPQHVGSFRLKDWTCVSALAGRFCTTEPPGKSLFFFLIFEFLFLTMSSF